MPVSQDAANAPLIADDQYEFSISLEYSLDSMELSWNSTSGRVNRHWSFPDAMSATSHFIRLLRHARVQRMSLSGPIPMHLLEVA